MTTSREEKHEFKAEVSALLRLVTNSLYTNREIFLRELVSNASDALDKARFQGLTDTKLRDRHEKPQIKVTADHGRGVLTIEDTGVGMTRDEIALNLGTIAHSGTLKFMEQARAQQESGQKPDVNLIGQFGVGFYSAFMVADRIDVTSLSAAEGAEPVHWSSTGDGTFSVGPGERTTRGTTIELHLKAEAKEFLDRWKIEGIIKRYSNYVVHPILLKVVDDKGNTEVDGKQVNDATAFWMRPARELTDADYNEFYKHVMGGFVLPGDEPLGHLHLHADAPIQFVALLYIPGKPPADLFQEDRKALQLYARRVVVMESCDKLLPGYLRFVRGLVDSEDLPLNVSREMLQEHSRSPRSAASSPARCSSCSRASPRTSPRPTRRSGTTTAPSSRRASTPTARTTTTSSSCCATAPPRTTRPSRWRSTSRRCPRASRPSTTSPASRWPRWPAARTSRPAARGYQVLYMADPIDEWVVQDLSEYKGKKLISVTQGDLDIPEDDQHKHDAGAIAAAVDKSKELLTDKVKDVRVSKRLRESAACLVDDSGGLSRNMERILKMARQDVPTRQRILELNPEHPFVQAVDKLAREAPGDDRLGTYVELLYDQAALAEGQVPDPAGLLKRFNSVLSGTIKI
ncbi:molecular chaperone HtpG [Nannocystis pusilla]|uniref:Chaperone protein HtpG n=1 Tax=Nannocystis pusilla TaxID=889268 RepID=A0A9X3EQD1_9BACT|nr:molecular chaperone HtpG [Nannocystis pusilla]